jgi:hypothetical protein
MGNKPARKMVQQSYQTMIEDAVLALKDRPGSTQADIFKYLENKYQGRIPPKVKKKLQLKLKSIKKRSRQDDVKRGPVRSPISCRQKSKRGETSRDKHKLKNRGCVKKARESTSRRNPAAKKSHIKAARISKVKAIQPKFQCTPTKYNAPEISPRFRRFHTDYLPRAVKHAGKKRKSRQLSDDSDSMQQGGDSDDSDSPE